MVDEKAKDCATASNHNCLALRISIGLYHRALYERYDNVTSLTYKTGPLSSAFDRNYN